MLNFDFLKSFLRQPGGISDYISRFLLEFYYFNWLGAFIITIAAFLICISFGRFLRNFSGSFSRIFIFIPALLILLIYNRYNTLSLLGILLALLLGNIYIWVSKKRGAIVSLFFYLLFTFIVYCFDIYSFWLFAFISVLWEIQNNKKYFRGYYYLGIELIFSYFIGRYILNFNGVGVFYFFLPFFYPENIILKLIILAVFTILSLLFLLRLKAKKTVFALPLLLLGCFQVWSPNIFYMMFFGFLIFTPLILNLFNEIGANSAVINKLRLNKTLVYPLMGILFFSTLFFNFDKQTHAILKINYCAQNKMWSDLLKTAENIPVNLYERNKGLYQSVFKALYYSGRLPYEQFNYPASLIYNMPYPRPNVRPVMSVVNPDEISDVCFSLGLINHSELMCSYSMQLPKREPVAAVKQLALIYIIKGHNAAAQKVLNRLKKSFFHKEWARKYEALLGNPSLMENDPYLMQAKLNMIKLDDVKDADFLMRISSKYDYEGVFKRLLAENKNNKMAFEYLMSYYLLKGRIQDVISNIGFLDSFDYEGIPRNYQEAILLNMFKTKNMQPDLSGRKIDKDIFDEYRYFYEVYKSNDYNAKAAYRVLRDKYANSYFVYYLKRSIEQKHETKQE